MVDLATVSVIGGLLGLGAIAVAPGLRGSTVPYENDVPMDEEFRAEHRDFDEAGLFLSAQRSAYLNMTNLNEAFKPRTAPRQKSTNNISDVLRSEADSVTYLKAYAPPFYFQWEGAMPLTTPVQSNPNVELPSCTSSIRHDPHNSLMTYPRAYCDYGTPAQNPHLFTYEPGTMNSSGQPTEWEVPFVPHEGYYNFNHSPYGPGGDLQRIFNAQARQITRQRGLDRSTLLQPPPSNYTSSRYHRRF